MGPATGKILWQTPDPAGAFDIGFVSAANGVVYGGSLATTGTNLYALHAATGKMLWSFASGGAAIVGGSVYRGSGYCGTKCFTAPTTNNNVYTPSASGKQAKPFTAPVRGTVPGPFAFEAAPQISGIR